MVRSSVSLAFWPQWLAGFSLSLLLLVGGFGIGWSSPYIAKLTAPDSSAQHPLKLTLAQASWIASILFLGKLFGCLLGLIVQDLIGRQKTLLFSGVPYAVGWILVIFATSVEWLYASRFLCGLSIGIVTTALPLFLAEIADPKIRGTLIVLNLNIGNVGASLGNTMGTFLTMAQFSYVGLSITGLSITLCAFVPESAYYYIAKGNTKKAVESLEWYTRTVDVHKELDDLRESIGSTSVSFVRRLNEFKKWEHGKNMIIMCCLILFIFGAGNTTVTAYLETILTNSKLSIKSSTIVIALSVCNIAAGFFSTIFVDKFGRRALLLASALGVCIAHILLGFHFHMLSLNIDSASITWLPIFSLFLFYCNISLGLGVVPYALLGELFPPLIKTIASFTFNTFASLTAFGVSKSYQPYLTLVGDKFLFWTFAVSALFSMFLTYFFIPETKRMKLIDIHQRKLSCQHAKTTEGNK